MWIYNSIQKKITFLESRKYCPDHHYHLKRHLLILQFSSIQSVKMFVQDFVPGNSKDIKTFSFSLNQEHFMEPITSLVNSIDPAKIFKVMRTLNISNHRNIDSSSFSPQKSNFCTIFSSTIYSTTYSLSIYWSNKGEHPIVIDSGASKSITPELSDFVGNILPMDTPIQGISATTKIRGMFTVKWDIWDSLGTPATIQNCAYYIPQADIHLFSLKEYFSENQAGSFLMNAKGTTVTLPVQISLQFGYHKNNNLPMASSKNSWWKNTSKTSHQLRKIY